MTLNLIGLGMTKKSISAEALEVVKSCEKIYLENYTVDFPYSPNELKESLGIEFNLLDRKTLENESIVDEAKNKNIAVLIYGDPLSATTHMQLIIACKEKNINFRVFHNSSILNVVGESGLQLYKFGKITSIPNWKEHKNKPTSFAKYIKENLEINAHSLVLIDIGMEIKTAINELREAIKKEKVKIPEKIIVLANAGGQNQRIFYEKIEKLENIKINPPFCIVIPAEMGLFEREAVENMSEQN